MFAQLTDEHLSYFKSILDLSQIITNQEHLVAFGVDETEDLVFLPDIALKPENTNQVAAILKYCNQEMLAVTTRGAGTGLSGGALPVTGGVVLDTSLMNKILWIDDANLQAHVQPGVINEVLRNTVEAMGLFYPPDPSSKGSCFLGGNIAESAGGPKAVKYGTTKDYVLNLEVVLADGSIIHTGANVLKNATGYNLTQLFVGSEGTLGVITKAVLRLIPLPKLSYVMLVPFTHAAKACEAVSAIFRAGITPSALEFMERDALQWAISYLNEPIAIPEHIQAHLLVEIDGNHPEELMQASETIAQVVEQYGADEILFADNEAQKNQLWRLRRNVAHAVKSKSIYKEEDTVVPRAELPKLLAFVKALGNKYGFQSVCYGHAGDGNLHINIIKGDLPDSVWQNDLPEAITLLFKQVKELGGTISGEHGIGWVQKQFMPIIFSDIHLHLMKQMKQVFDPKGILNPHKIFPN